MKVLIVVLLFCIKAFGRQGFGPNEQEWGYVTVREGAHMFWWLHQTTYPGDYTERPLLVWLQGGPGGSSTGYGNFAELGPLDLDINPRDYTWINEYNVLFVDNPVGAGFSYVDNPSAFTTTNRQIAEDFLVLLQNFYQTIPELKKTPLYIFSQSYGGKMTPEIALVVDQAIKDGLLDVNLLGVGLGAAWASPVDSVLSWGPYLLQWGAVDQNGYERVQQAALATKEAFDRGEYKRATDLWRNTEGVIWSVTARIDFYNILTKIPITSGRDAEKRIFKPEVFDDDDDKLDRIMNTLVKQRLGLNVTWGAQRQQVFSYLSEDFMKPVLNIIELLLNTTDIRVGIYNGQLDLIVDGPGNMKWVDELNFEGSSEWKVAEKNPIDVDNIVEGYHKRVGNLAFYWVNRAGHSIPPENPAAMNFILQDIINGQWKN